MKWIKIVLPVAIFAVGFGGMQAIMATASDDKVQEKVDTRPSVTVDKLDTDSYTVEITAYGEVSPLEITKLAAQVSGEIVSWNKHFVNGGLVKRGETLFTIEKDAYEAALLLAEANVTSAKAQLIQEEAQAQVAKEEAAKLTKGKVSDLYLRKPQLLSAQAALKSAKAQLKIAQRDLDNCEVKAPYDALVVSRDIGVGDFVSTGMITATLYSIETAEVTFPVAGFDQAFLPDQITQRKATVNSGSSKQTERSAWLHRDTGIVDQATRMAHLVARIDDPYGIRSQQRPIKFGSYVKVNFSGKTVDNVYRIPQELVTNKKLWTLDKEDKLISNEVDVVREDGGYFLIRGDFDQNRVVKTLPEYPQEGIAVKVIPTDAKVAMINAAKR
ncbi:efflux RND transporter periplasmic adaptor subunit [Alteromonas sp. ASW11-130]|uniref:efflux RND transporter periplasmic adaptor subunit n=1 Tax=Alteromonas sp. ASW11-130 TaxID=3015775 RepID=UPI0022419E9D|nr:efflux RND transporter periplasmic adaptor subunit [Alteromonas sp. ASW11-130]MCW8091516.1 efflux RND transporter periplasmic adaptor subunit [Alteromonas sp. ASW11-130]